MKIDDDWAELKKRVKWLHTSFGLGRMVAEWEGNDGVRRKVEAVTSLDLFSRVRSEIDASELEPPIAEPAKWPEPKYPGLQFGPPETPDEYRARMAELDRLIREFPTPAHAKNKNEPPQPTKPKPPTNPYRRKFG